MSTDNQYFATAAKSDIGDKIVGRYDKLCAWINPMANKWAAAHAAYYGDVTVAGRTWTVSRRGEEGELAAVRINRARQLSKARQALICSSRVVWSARASKVSAKSAVDTTLAKQLLESAWKREGMSQVDLRLVELSEVYSEGYCFVAWDRTRGKDMPAPGGGIARAGEPRLCVMPPWYVKTDPYRTSAEQQDWWFVRLERTKADLVALYPKLLDGREGEEAKNAIWNVTDPWLRQMNVNRPTVDNDLAPEVHFIHRPTLALPEGRHTIFCNNEVLLADKPLVGEHGDYDKEAGLPLIRLAADEYVDSPYGWTSFFDSLGPQEVLDAMDTTQATIVTTYGNPSFVYEKGTDLEPADVAKGFRPIQMQPGQQHAPSYLVPPELAESHLKYREELISDQREIMGLNEAALGQTSQTDKNAQADALAASMAVQQAGAAVQGRRAALSKIGTAWLGTLRHNVNDERIVQLVGSGEKGLVADSRRYTGNDLAGIGEVEPEEISPMEQTQQGRWAIAEQYIQMGLCKTPQDIEEVRNTGRLEGVVNPSRDEELLIRAENEMLQNGKVPPMHPTQNQILHYQKNAAVLLSISALDNPGIVRAVQTTLDARYAMYFGTPPAGDPLEVPRRRFMLGQGAEPMPPPPPPPGMGPPGPNAGPPGKPPPAKLPVPAGGPSINAPKSPLDGAPVGPGSPPPMS